MSAEPTLARVRSDQVERAKDLVLSLVLVLNGPNEWASWTNPGVRYQPEDKWATKWPLDRQEYG